MFQNRTFFTSVIALAMCIPLPLISGCRNAADELPLAETTGLVTLDGKPLSSGTVTFVPDVIKGNTGPTGVGKIGTDGVYRIVTAKRDGALVGFHKIRVNSTDASKPGAPWLIPIRYDHPDRSGLTCEIKADQTNDVPLNLVTAPQGASNPRAAGIY